MSHTPLPCPSDDAAAQQAGDAPYYRRVLHELIDMGADMARLVHREAARLEADAAPDRPGAETVPGLAVAFDRITRAVRRTIGLAQRLDQRADGQAAGRRVAGRRQIIRAVEDSIQRRADAGEQEALEAELLERLDGPDLDDDIDHRPIADIIADICRDLGLAAPAGTQPWKRRTPGDIAMLCERAARTGASRTEASRTGASRTVVSRNGAAPEDRAAGRSVRPGLGTGRDPPSGRGMRVVPPEDHG